MSVDPTIKQAIIYYRKVADEATRAANNLEGLLSVLESESLSSVPEHTCNSKSFTLGSETVTVDDIKRMLGTDSARIPKIAYFFEMPEVDIEKLVTPKNGFKVSSNGWVKVV